MTQVLQYPAASCWSCKKAVGSCRKAVCSRVLQTSCVAYLLKTLVPLLSPRSALGLPHIVVIQHKMLCVPLRQKLLSDGGKVPPKQQQSLLKLLCLMGSPAVTNRSPHEAQPQGLLSSLGQGPLKSCPSKGHPGNPVIYHTVPIGISHAIHCFWTNT